MRACAVQSVISHNLVIVDLEHLQRVFFIEWCAHSSAPKRISCLTDEGEVCHNEVWAPWAEFKTRWSLFWSDVCSQSVPAPPFLTKEGNHLIIYTLRSQQYLPMLKRISVFNVTARPCHECAVQTWPVLCHFVNILHAEQLSKLNGLLLFKWQSQQLEKQWYP